MLESPELVALADWVWGSFHPGGQPLTEEQKQVESQKLMSRLHQNSDGAMDFDEFAAWFQKTCKDVQRYRSALATKPTGHTAEPKAVATAAEPVMLDAAMVRAKKKFDQLDEDSN